MSVDKVREYLNNKGCSQKIIEFEADTATVALAAQAVGCEEKMIAKTLSFDTAAGPILIIASGEAKVDNRRFKDKFTEKAKMIPYDEVESKIGHAPGGVCPFAVADGVKVYADISLERFETFYPAAGSSHSAIPMSCDDLTKYGNVVEWIDVCKGWREDEQ